MHALPKAMRALLRGCIQATIPHLTRSSLHRCLQRHGISRLPDVDGDKPGQKTLAASRWFPFFMMFDPRL